MDHLYNVVLNDPFVFYPAVSFVFYFLFLEAARKTKLVFTR
jgi:hypothetical protein